MHHSFPILVLNVAGKVIQFLKRPTEQRGMRMSALRTLSVIQAKPGVSPSQLARALNIQPPSITELIGAYIKTGLVEKYANPQDQRSVHLRLTAEGKKELRALFNDFAREMDKICELLTKEERIWLERIFNKLDAELAKNKEGYE